MFKNLILAKILVGMIMVNWIAGGSVVSAEEEIEVVIANPNEYEAAAIYKPHGVLRQLKYLTAYYVKPSALENFDISYAYSVSDLTELQIKKIISDNKSANLGYGLQLSDGSIAVISDDVASNLSKEMGFSTEMLNKLEIVSKQRISVLDKLLKTNGKSAEVISSWNDEVWKKGQEDEVYTMIEKSSDWGNQ
ncbi:MAG: hypothetical protein V7723_12400 [Sneathiella sp.]|uniref:hypothetical protein n=1 Tax=Sneathiella sp. TaxID=1964365 RepID=UPI00300294B3